MGIIPLQFESKGVYNYEMIQQKMQAEQITALKTNQKEKLSTLRMVLAQIKNAEIEKKTPLSDEEVVVVIRKFVKELKESISAFEKGNRQDLVQESQRQLEVVSSFLPPEATDEELTADIKKIIAENQQIVQQNPKALMGICVKQLKSKAEPGRIIAILNKINTL